MTDVDLDDEDLKDFNEFWSWERSVNCLDRAENYDKTALLDTWSNACLNVARVILREPVWKEKEGRSSNANRRD